MSWDDLLRRSEEAAAAWARVEARYRDLERRYAERERERELLQVLAEVSDRRAPARPREALWSGTLGRDPFEPVRGPSLSWEEAEAATFDAHLAFKQLLRERFGGPAEGEDERAWFRRTYARWREGVADIPPRG